MGLSQSTEETATPSSTPFALTDWSKNNENYNKRNGNNCP